MISRTTGSYIIQSATESTATIDKDRVTISVSLAEVIEISRVVDDAEATVKLQSTINQPISSMQKIRARSILPVAEPTKPKLAEYAID